MTKARPLWVLALVAWLVVGSVLSMAGIETWYSPGLERAVSMRVWAASAWWQGHVPLWVPMDHGQPWFVAGVPILYGPDMLLFGLLSPALALAFSVALHQLLAGLGAFYWAHAQGRSLWAALFAGVGWGAAPMLLHPVGAMSSWEVFAWMPWLAVSVSRRWWLLAVASVAMMGWTGATSIALWSLTLAVFWTVRQPTSGWNRVRSGGALGVLSLMVLSPALLPGVEKFSLTTGNIFSPSGCCSPALGALTLVFALFAGIRGLGWGLASGALGLFAEGTWGTAGWAWFMLAWVQHAAGGVDRVQVALQGARVDAELRAWALIAGSSSAVVGAGVARMALGEHQMEAHALIAPWMETSDPKEAKVQAEAWVDQLGARLDPRSPDVLWAVLLLWLLASLWLLAAAKRVDPRIPSQVAGLALALELMQMGRASLAVGDPRVWERPPQTLPIMGEPGNWRVADLTSSSALPAVTPTSGLVWGLESVSSALTKNVSMNAYSYALIGALRGGEGGRPSRLVDLSGVRFLWADSGVAPHGWTRREARDEFALWENPHPLPRAFSVPCTWSVADGALDALSAVNPEQFAIVEGPGLAECGAGGMIPAALRRESLGWSGTISLTDPGWLVVTETWEPGIRLEIDHRLVAPQRTDAVFAGAALEPGEHSFRWYFWPHGFGIRLALAGTALAISALGAIWVGVQDRTSSASSQ